MNKQIIMLLIMLTTACQYPVNAQSFLGGVFNQKQTQRKLYLQQIAALQVYLGYLKSGYKTVNNGLTVIHGAKNGELGLHKGYFNSLYQVNPAVAKNSKVKAILQFQEDIKTCFNQTITQVQQSGYFSKEETGHMRNVYTHLLQQCDKDLDELSKIVTPGSMQMTDDERIRGIDRIYTAMQDKYAFARSFTGNAKLLAAQRGQRDQELDKEIKLYRVN